MTVSELAAQLPEGTLRNAILRKGGTTTRVTVSGKLKGIPEEKQLASVPWAMWDTPPARSALLGQVKIDLEKPDWEEPDWVVIGGGVHGTIAALNLEGQVTVIDEGGGGGIFAASGDTPAFWLNSRNKPGDLGLPNDPDSGLNVLPGASLQPSMLSTQEYQTNAEMAFCVRYALAADPTVRVRRARAESIGADGKTVLTSTASSVQPRRGVVWATGVGEDIVSVPIRNIEQGLGKYQVLSFTRLLRVMASMPSSFRGWERVAVVGGNDSGCVTVEALLGLGPSVPPPCDRLDRVTWLGPQMALNRGEYEDCARSRYFGLGRSFPSGRGGGAGRIKPIRGRVTEAICTEDGIVLRYDTPDASCLSEQFDHVVFCTGFRQELTEFRPLLDNDGFEDVLVDGLKVGRRLRESPVFLAGPCADFPVTAQERAASPALRDIPENSAALFRYGQRTEALARTISA